MARATAPSAAPLPELVHADPLTLVVGANVRVDANVGKDFVASIRERGVIEPIVAHRDDAGDLVVLHGQRRTIGAIQAKRPTVPVLVVNAPADVDRLVDQLAENDHRTSLSMRERVGAYEQLAAHGVTAAQIAKRTAAPKAQIAAALAVASSEVALNAAQATEMTLEQAAIVAEFEDDEVAVERIVSTVDRGGSLDHVVTRLRDERVNAARIAEAAAPYLEAGLTVVERPEWNSTTRDLERLGIAEEDHRDCPGHALYIQDYWDDGDDEDQADDDQPTTEPTKVYEPVYVCTNPGIHVIEGAPAGPAGPDDADQDAKREAERAARRDVIESNKAWDLATEVRRRWLRTYLSRKSAPKVAPFIALALARANDGMIRAMSEGNQLAHELLGIEMAERSWYENRSAAIVDQLAGVTEARAQVIALAIILAGYERWTVSRDCWRNPTPGACDYLRFIESQGYELSDVERRACGETIEVTP